MTPGSAGAVVDRRRPGFFAICLGNFVIMLDTNVVNLALPHIRSSLGGSLGLLLWVVNGYTLTVAALILPGGATGDRLGGGRAYRLGLIGFAAASAACGLAPNLAALIGFRVIQGMFAAVLLPSLLALIPNLFPEPGPRARAVALWGSTGAVALAVGPLAAGILIDSLGWQAIFFVNVPICVGVYFLARWAVPDLPGSVEAAFDVPGQVLAILAMGAWAFVLTEGSTFGWTAPAILCAGVVGLLVAPAFVLVQTRGRNPLIPPRLFADRDFTIGTIAGPVFQFVYFGALFLLPLYLQSVHRTGALAAGVQLLPLTVATALAPPLLTGRLMIRFGLRGPVLLATLFGVPGFLLMWWCDGSSRYWVLGAALAMQGMWSGLALPPIAALAVTGPPPDLAGTASGVFNAGRQFGGVLGVAVLGTVAAAAPSIVGGMHAAMAVAAAGVLVVAAVVRSAPHARAARRDP
ncbi:DHA2 family efflux MFS transporter permease subunit [Nocardia sp. alder85J]|uniref:DHA2 family efflux MFS transporter permease subunit n=1 Tax=Nocardia sp. alder85J TaxID=2862949 RepID=UPI001CD3BD07|nr:DHA2 family efflux MFS transporter permease subunit [Nocardia sp. alder85J]MCX4094106.1 DHA2 family efflux MFS transporter permease subunit [Nocardia sp. alder85J]